MFFALQAKSMYGLIGVKSVERTLNQCLKDNWFQEILSFFLPLDSPTTNSTTSCPRPQGRCSWHYIRSDRAVNDVARRIAAA